MIRVSILALLLVLSSVAVAQPAPLTDDERAIVDAIPDGRGGTVDRSYLVTNEWGHRVFFPHLEGLGGALVGVGSDQSYTLAAASGAELVFMVDYDPIVPRGHRIYNALVPTSPTPDALLARFAPENADASARVIEEQLGDAPDRDAVVRLYRRHRDRLQRYLRNLRGYRHGRTWLNDDAWYAWVRALHAGGRVVARTGDLTAPGTLRGIGDAARALGVPVRTVYFSNAEMFFANGPALVENVQSLPTDERTVLLRTAHDPPLEPAPFCRWHYVVQPFPDYLARLATGRYLYANSMVEDLVRARRRRPRETEGLSVLDARIPMRDER